MPEVLDEMPHASAYANPKREERMSAPTKPVVVSTNHTAEAKANWPMTILTTGGSATGAAFLGGAFLGPAGAIGGTVFGIVLGLFLHSSKK